MQQTLRISRGKWKGKPLKMPPRVKGNTHVTPGVVKEAVFQLLSTKIGNLSEYVFYDLCAGSGQMGMEALSIGYGSVNLCEVDAGRFRFLVEEIKRLKMNISLHKRDFRRASSLMVREKKVVAYLDPPYTFWDRSGGCESIDRLLYNLACAGTSENGESEEAGGVVSENLEHIYLIIQGPSPYNGHLPDPSDCHPSKVQAVEEMRETRDYRGNWITILELSFNREYT